MKKSKSEVLTSTPFETIEGITEVWLYDEVFGCNIHFITDTKSHDNVKHWMQRVFNIKDPSLSKYDNLSARGECVTIGYQDGPGLKATVIHMGDKWVENLDNILILCHEATHATYAILSNKGIKHTEETDEIFAYFQESLVSRFVMAMRKPVIKYDRPKKPQVKKKCLNKKVK